MSEDSDDGSTGDEGPDSPVGGSESDHGSDRGIEISDREDFEDIDSGVDVDVDVDLPDPFGGDGAAAPGGRTLLGLVGGFFLLLVAVLWLIRPWLHPLVYGIVWKYPGVLQWGVLTFALGIVGLWTIRTRPIIARLLLLVGIITLVLTLFGPFIGNQYMNERLATEVGNEVTSLEEIPETDATAPRILPAAVGTQFAQNSLQFPRHTLAAADISFIDGTPHWAYALKPDGAVNTFVGKQAGAVFVNMTTQAKRVTVEEAEFTCGQGQLVTDDYSWKLHKEKFTVEYHDPFMLERDGDLYMAVPYVRHTHQFRATPLPQVYATPEFGGVALIDADCSITHLSPDEAQEHPVLAGQRFYPYDLARLKVNSMQYQRGILNKWFTHEDQLEIAPLPGVDNDQPFVVPTEAGITYFVAAEPWGNAAGIYQLWTIDGRTGSLARFKTNVSDALLGPRKAANFVEKNNPRVNWNSLSPSEPIPVVRNGTVYWEIRVVPDSGAGVSYIAFVNAGDGDVLRLSTDEEIRDFIAGREVDIGTGSNGNRTGEEADLVVLVIDDEGNVVRRVPVGDTQRIRVERAENETVTSRPGTGGNPTTTTAPP